MKPSRRSETICLVIIFLGLCFLTVPAQAGVADWPLPTLVPGKKTHHVYSVSGVGGFAGGFFGTFFSCTSTDRVPIQVSVEVFSAGVCGLGPCSPANDAVASSLTFTPGDTRMFGTCTSPLFFLDSTLAACIVTRGSARILSTSKKLICTAFLADRINSTPTATIPLTIVKKATQKGD